MSAKERWLKVLICLVLTLGTAALYYPVVGFDYVNYDDGLYIVANQHIRTLDWQSIHWAFVNNYARMWHPLTWISHIVDFHFFGLANPGGHHLTSVIIHIFNTTLLFVVLHRLTKALWPSAVVAALFAWHPLHVESVAWISERKDVLSAFFWLLTMWAYVRYAEMDTRPGPGRRWFYGLTLLFYVLGLMSKPMLVTMPFVFLLMDWWPLRRWQTSPTSSGNAGPRRPSLGALFLEKGPFLGLAMAASLVSVWAARSWVQGAGSYPIRYRLINAVLVYARYVEQMFWPHNLMPVYPPINTWTKQDLLLSVLFLLVISGVAMRQRNTRPYWLFGWLWYLGILLPVMGIVAVGAPPQADHNTYLPAIGVFLIVCWEAADLAAGRKEMSWIMGGAAVAVLGACWELSSHQLQIWRNPSSLYEHNLQINPRNYIARADYAAYLRDVNRLEESREQVGIALKLLPSFPFAHDVLGGVDLLEHKLTDASNEFSLVLKLDPSRRDAYAALGQIALLAENFGEAESQFRTYLKIDPGDPGVHCGLAQALIREGKLDEGKAELTEALRLGPRDTEALYYMAVLMEMEHQTKEAIADYHTAISINGARVDVLNNLAWILATDPNPENRNGAEAVELAKRACALSGNRSPFFIGTLAAACAEAGQFDEAVAAAENAVDLATKLGNQPLADRNRQLLELYRAHKPYRTQ